MTGREREEEGGTGRKREGTVWCAAWYAVYRGVVLVWCGAVVVVVWRVAGGVW